MRTAESVVLTDWPPGPRRAEDVDAQVLVVDLDVDLLGLGQHRHGRGRGVDAALRLGRRHALHAVHARFELQPGEHAAAGDGGDRLLVAADAGVGELHDLEAPAVLGGVALVHAEQIGGEQRRLVAAGAGADFQDGVLLVGRVLGQQHALHGALELRQALLQRRRLFLGHGLHVGIGGHRPRRRFSSRLGLAPFADRLDQRPEVGIFLRGRDELLRIETAARQRCLQLGVAGERSGRVSCSNDTSILSAFSAPARASSATSRCSPLSRSFSCATPLASSSSPMMTAARALSLLARCMRRFMLPR